MPLKKGSSSEIISENIRELINSGKTSAQAAAIAYQSAGKTRDEPRYYTTARLSEHISQTPEGYLLCEAVPIARTGELLYQDGELIDAEGSSPVDAGSDGVIKITRYADELFSPETIASIEGKPITIDHPADFVTPETWRNLAVGTMLNVRPGTGADSDKLLADFLITSADGISMIKSGLREVSLGYDAEYEQVRPGLGKQSKILCNHGALVRRGRNGPQIAVRDHKPKTTKRGNKCMTLKNKLLAAFGRTLDEAMPEVVEEITTDASPLEERLARIEALIVKMIEHEQKSMMEMTDADEEELENADITEVMQGENEQPSDMDIRLQAIESALSKLLGHEMEIDTATIDSETVSQAEVVAPGLAPSRTLVKDALSCLARTTEGKKILSTFDGMSPKNKLKACAEVIKAKRAAQLAPTVDSFRTLNNGPMTPERINQMNELRHKKVN